MTGTSAAWELGEPVAPDETLPDETPLPDPGS
jgi:hypothetical protein